MSAVQSLSATYCANTAPKVIILYTWGGNKMLKRKSYIYIYLGYLQVSSESNYMHIIVRQGRFEREVEIYFIFMNLTCLPLSVLALLADLYYAVYIVGRLVMQCAFLADLLLMGIIIYPQGRQEYNYTPLDNVKMSNIIFLFPLRINLNKLLHTWELYEMKMFIII